VGTWVRGTQALGASAAHQRARVPRLNSGNKY